MRAAVNALHSGRSAVRGPADHVPTLVHRLFRSSLPEARFAQESTRIAKRQVFHVADSIFPFGNLRFTWDTMSAFAVPGGASLPRRRVFWRDGGCAGWQRHHAELITLHVDATYWFHEAGCGFVATF